MILVFIVNEHTELSPTQTTSLLALHAAELGHEVYIAGVGALGLRDDGHVLATCWRLRPGPAEDGVVVATRLQPRPTLLDLLQVDVIWIRTNPARDGRGWAHHAALKFLRIAQDAGVLVLNDPRGLERASSKLYLHRVPAQHRPRTLVTGSTEQLRAFIRQAPGGRVVLKPLIGTRGRDVFQIDGERAPNLNAIMDVLLREGYVICQDFVPEAVEGDTRLVILQGRLFIVEGQPLVVRRVPSAEDFRSNVAVGGRAAPAEVTDAMLACVEAIGPLLEEDGLLLVGVDFIGGKLVEINAFSTGGFHDAEQFYEKPFARACVEAVLDQRPGQAHRQAP